jgi:hypothetical protein
LYKIQFDNSQNINFVGTNCFYNTSSSPNKQIYYYNATNYNNLPPALQNTQSQFTSFYDPIQLNPAYYYFPYIYQPTITNNFINMEKFISKKSKKQTIKTIKKYFNNMRK